VLLAVFAGLALAAPAGGVSGGAASGGPSRPVWEKKLDPFLRRMALGSSRLQGRFADPIPAGSVEALRTLPPFIRADRGAAAPVLLVKARLAPEAAGSTPDWTAIERRLEATGAQVRGRVGEIVSLRVPAAALERIASLPEIAWIKAARSYRLLNEVSTGLGNVNSDQANGSPLNTRGRDVIVGVVDTGIQWEDRDFRNADGSTRVLGIWDMTLTDPLHPPPAGFTFGAYYSRSDIDAAPPPPDPGALLTRDGHGHGTHVAGSAAGNGLNTGNGVAPAGTFAGVAPEADLLIVRVFDDNGVFCNDCDLTAATQFIRDTAAALGKPWVGNMSLGTDLGAHDGTDPDELAISEAVGPGHRGAQMAIAAGNSGARRMHWEGVLAAGSTFTNTFCFGTGTPPSCGTYAPRPGEDNDFAWLDLWYEGADRATVEIVTPGGQTVRAAPGADSLLTCTTSGAVQIDATGAPDPANGDNEVFIQIWDSGLCNPFFPVQSGVWTIRIITDSVASATREFDLWNEADLDDTGGFPITHARVATATFDESVGIPATSLHAIAAASFVNKCQWTNVAGQTTTISSCSAGAISSFSAIGPTRDGRMKPDVGAPGGNVGSSLAGLIESSRGTNFTERDGAHGVISGTSMATPHVAGTAALLLSPNPALQGPEVKAAIQRSARADSFTGTVPNTRFGSGKLRAPEAGFQAASIVTDLGAASATDFTATDNPLVDSYNVYRGTIPGLSAANYGCRLRDLTGLPSPSFTDAAVPLLDQAFFYLVAGVQGGIEGILGTDSSGNVIPAGPACP
jgi:subtilisin family serine protease